MSDPTTAGREGRALRSALLLAGAAIAAWIAMYLPQPALPDIAAEYSVGPGAAGAVVSVLTLAIAFASLIVAPLSDRFGRRRLLIASSLGMVVPSLACALAPGLGWLLLFRFAQGALVAGTVAIALAYLGEEFDHDTANRLAGVFIAATVTGGIVSRLLGGGLSDAFGWRWAFVASAAISLAAGLALAAGLPPSRGFTAQRDLRAAFGGMWSHLRDGRLLRLYAIGFFFFFAFLGLFNALPFRLDAPPYGLGAGAIGVAYLTYGAGVVSSNVSGPLLARSGPRRLLTIALAGTLLFHLLTLLTPLPLLIAALLAMCFTHFLAQGAVAGLLATGTRHNRAGANALYLLAYYVGGSAGSALLPLVWGRVGWGGVIVCTAAALIASTLAAATLPRREAIPD